MTPAYLAAQREIDEEILNYIREMQGTAPIRAESVCGFLVHIRRRRLMASYVADRLAYLVSRGFLEAKREWEGGEGDVTTYTISAAGRDVLDLVKPW